MKRTIFLLSVLAAGLIACSKEMGRTGAPDSSAAAEAPVFHFNIPASFDDPATKAITFGETSITHAFADTDKVYVFIERSGSTIAMSHNGTNAYSYLSPTVITGSGAGCTLEGALKFYTYDENQDAFDPFEPAIGDVVHLLYNMNHMLVYAYYYPLDYAGFDYNNQNGSQNQSVYENIPGYGPMFISSGACSRDFARAKMKVTAVAGDATDGYSLTLAQYDDPSKSDVHFENTGSMFRQRLYFNDKNGDPLGTISTLRNMIVALEGGELVYVYTPFSDPSSIYQTRASFYIKNPTVSPEGDVHLALMFYDGNKGKPLSLQVMDNDFNVYSVAKAAPAGGFQNGKYYYGSATLAWQKCIKPTVSGTAAEPQDYVGLFQYNIDEDPVDLTIGGSCEDFCFYIRNGHGGQIALDNLSATIGRNSFLAQGGGFGPGELSIVLTGTNNITVTNTNLRGCDFQGNIKLSCTGTSATLTVTTREPWTCGIRGANYWDSNNSYSNLDELGVTSLIAADGFTVIRSARVNNPDESYTWTYTVTPTPAP